MKKTRIRSLSIENLEFRRLLAAVDIPNDLTGAPAALVSVPVNIDNAASVRGAEIRLSYNTELLDLNPDAITAGSVWTGSDTQVTVNVDDAAGTVVVFVSASETLASASGSLVILPFSITSSAAVGNTVVFDLTEVTLNEGQVAVTPSPITGSDSTDGLLTIVEDGSNGIDRIAGFVFADTNGNNSPDTVEGIPGVVITFTNTATGQVRQATTDDLGRYEFANLPEAAYQVVETQPIAYLEGGANEASVTVVSGQSVSDQNFRELGLLPQYIYNRLHTTSVRPVGSATWINAIRQINVNASASAEVTESAILASKIETSPPADVDLPNPTQATSQPQGEFIPTPIPYSSITDNKSTSDEILALDRLFASTGLW